MMNPIAVNFPLKGEWCALHTPGHKVPSHGTDQLGQTYAYDFFQIDWSKTGYKFHNTPRLKSLVLGVKLMNIYCWSQPIYAPFDGLVVEVMDGLTERNPVHFVRDLAVVLKNGFFFNANDNRELHPVLGNFVILKKEDGIFALIAHAKTGSIQVAKGEPIKQGQVLAEVGHSGNSSAPHLHFQLMDNPNLLEAKGLPCCFTNYQAFKDGTWETVHNGIPGKRVRIKA